MASLKDIKYKVVAIRKTKQITRAMNMVSTAKLRSAQRNAEHCRVYQEEYTNLLNDMVVKNPTYTHPFLQEKPMANTIIVVLVTPDRGLCGSFATGIIQQFKAFLNEQKNQGITVQCYCIGRKGYDAVKKIDCSIIGYDIGIMSSITFDKAQSVAHEVQKQFLHDTIHSVYLIYGHFSSLMMQAPCIKKILPIIPNITQEEDSVDVIYEPNSVILLNEIVPKITAITIFDAFLDTIVSEHAARMIAMNNATKNCDDLIASFSRLYNKVRQAAVTKELMDIVGGAEALNS